MSQKKKQIDEKVTREPSKSRGTGALFVKGIGEVRYDKVLKKVDIKQWCEELIPDEGMNRRTTIEVDVYLDGDKIVHITKNRGKYDTEDLTAKAITEIEEGRGSSVTHTIAKTDWLSLGNKRALADLWLFMKRTGWDLARVESELTPVYYTHKGGEYDGMIFPSVLVRLCSGKSGVGFGWYHEKYPKEDTLRRIWQIKCFEEINGVISIKHRGGFYVTHLEGTREAIEKWKPIFEEEKRKQREERKKRTIKRKPTIR